MKTKLADLGRRLWRAFNDHALADTAAELSYYLIFSLFSLLFFLVTLAAYLPLKTSMAQVLKQLSRVAPAQAMHPIEQQLRELLNNPRPKLLTAGLLVSLWTASRSLDAFRKGLNLAYDVTESRPWWRTQLMAVTLTMGESILVLASFAGLALGGKVGSWLANRVGVEREFVALWGWLRWPATACIVMLAAALAYYLLPDVEQRFKYISPGSVTATVLWLLASYGFGEYVNHLANYSVTYGSVGTAVVLLTWMYLSGLVFLLGGEMNAAIEHASRDGKRAGARAPNVPPPPQHVRPSASPPGAVKARSSAGRIASPHPGQGDQHAPS